jgi:hypothetical protein
VAFHAGWPLVDLIDASASNAINYTRSSDGYVLVSPLYGNELARLQRRPYRTGHDKTTSTVGVTRLSVFSECACRTQMYLSVGCANC